MFCKPGDQITFLFFAQIAASGLGKTGLTVTVSVNEDTTNKVTVASTTACIALDATNQPGLYYYRHTVTAGFYGIITAQATTTDTTCIVRSLQSLYISVLWLTYLDAAITTRMATFSYTTPPTAAAIGDAVWDEAIADHVAAGSTGKALSTAGAASDPLLNAVPGAYASGTAGRALGSISSAAITVVNPVAQNGDVTVRQGKDYSATIGTAIQWTLTTPPGTTPTNVTFTCLALGISKVCSYTSPTITLTLTAAETSLMGAGVFAFEVEAVISTLKTALVSGDLTVQADV
jgi:hypothetical protein